METSESPATPDSSAMPQLLDDAATTRSSGGSAYSAPAQPAEVESIPTQTAPAPTGAVPWLPTPADGDPRPWPTFALTPAQRAIAAPARPPRAVPLPRVASPPTGATSAGTPAAPRMAPAQPGAPQRQPQRPPPPPYIGSGYAGPGGYPANPNGFAPRQGQQGQSPYAPAPSANPPQFYQAPPFGAPMQHQQLQMAPVGRGGAQGLAVSSLVLGIIAVLITCGGYGFVLGVPGIITGHLSLNRFDTRWAPPSAYNLARWGLGLSYTATIISLLVLLYFLSHG